MLHEGQNFCAKECFFLQKPVRIWSKSGKGSGYFGNGLTPFLSQTSPSAFDSPHRARHGECSGIQKT
ncbi:MAG: hypothetical protein KDD14_26460, partial [Saprospiraceae bacterium]|nr:hypothetical protein [Saprospiraceae bacterium]